MKLYCVRIVHRLSFIHLENIKNISYGYSTGICIPADYSDIVYLYDVNRYELFNAGFLK